MEFHTVAPIDTNQMIGITPCISCALQQLSIILRMTCIRRCSHKCNHRINRNSTRMYVHRTTYMCDHNIMLLRASFCSNGNATTKKSFEAYSVHYAFNQNLWRKIYCGIPLNHVMRLILRLNSDKIHRTLSSVAILSPVANELTVHLHRFS